MARLCMMPRDSYSVSVSCVLPRWFRKFGKTAIRLLKPRALSTKVEHLYTQPFPKPVTGFKRFIMGTLTFEGVIEKTLTEFMLSTENEHNWLNRQTLLKQLSQVFQENPTVPRWAWDKMKLVMSRIIATAASERTQLSKQACETIGTLFQASGTEMHPFLETTLPTILQLCGSAKRQNQVNGNNAMKTIIQFSGYHKSLLHHICSTFSDKRKDARALAPAWLTQFLNTYKDTLDPTKDLPIIEKALAVGLADSDVKTREGTREAFWRYHSINEAAADAIMNTLNPHAASALRADKHNPNKSSAPAKAGTRPESALAKIRAQNKQKAAEAHAQGHTQGHTQPEAKRDFSNTSIFTKEYPFRPIEGLNEYLQDPNPKPEYALNEQAQRKLRDEHKALVKASIRDESTPIYELHGQEELKKKPSKHRLDGTHESKSADARHAADTSTNARPFLSAPVRRPRVVATPITHDKPGSRSMTKAEATRKAEQQKARAQPHRSGRHTPTITEEKPTEAHLRPSTKAHKSWVQSEQNPAPGTSSSRPTSSSSEPVAIKSPRGHTHQSASTSVLPHRPGKTVAAGSEFSPTSWEMFPKFSKRGPNGTATPKNGSLDAGNYFLPPFESPKKASLPFSPSSLEGTTMTNNAPAEAHLDLQRRIEAAQMSNQAVDFSKLKPMSPPEQAIVPIAAQENTVQSPGKSKLAAAPDEGLLNARQTLPKVTDAVKEGRLDALGYRKLRKLLLTYPGQLFTGVGADETYTGLYIALVNHFTKNERPAEAKQPSHNHSMYTSMAIIDMLQLLITQYPYGEPQPGMTLIALMMVKASQTLAPQVDDKIRSSMLLFVNQILERFNPLPVMDAISDAIEAKNAKLLDTGVFVLTKLVVGARERGYVLDKGHQQRLADLLRMCLLRMRPSSKRQAMQFATVLFDTIKPEERFRALFREESDLNLIYYCIGKVRDQQAAAAVEMVEEREEGGL